MCLVLFLRIGERIERNFYFFGNLNVRMSEVVVGVRVVYFLRFGSGLGGYFLFIVSSFLWVAWSCFLRG